MEKRLKLSDAEKGGSGLQLGMQERMSLYRNPDGSITIARQVKGQVRPDILGILDERKAAISLMRKAVLRVICMPPA